MSRRRWHALVMTLALSALLAGGAACGDDDPEPDATSEGDGEGDGGADAPGGGDEAADKAAVPNACDVLAPATIEAAFGADPGAGTANSADPSRTICTYENGFVFGVSEGSQFDTAAALTRDNAECEDVADVGDKAIFCITGGASGQLMWLDGDLMYDATSVSTSVDAFKVLAEGVEA